MGSRAFWTRAVAVVVLVPYACVAGVLLFTPENTAYDGGVNLVPFATIGDAITLGYGWSRIYLVLNLLLLVPFGIALGLTRVRRGIAAAVLVGVSVAIEVVQFAIPGARASDIDDVLLNSFGAIVAMLVVRAGVVWRARRDVTAVL